MKVYSFTWYWRILLSRTINRKAVYRITNLLLFIPVPYPACFSNPCKNKGMCSDRTKEPNGVFDETGYTCTCLAGYDGRNCERKIVNSSYLPVTASICLQVWQFEKRKIPFYAILCNFMQFNLSMPVSRFRTKLIGDSWYNTRLWHKRPNRWCH